MLKKCLMALLCINNMLKKCLMALLYINDMLKKCLMALLYISVSNLVILDLYLYLHN